MSKVPYIVNVDEYICSAFERIQHHASKMEQALGTYDDIKYGIRTKAWDESVTDEEFRKYCKDKTEKWKRDSVYD